MRVSWETLIWNYNVTSPATLWTSCWKSVPPPSPILSSVRLLRDGIARKLACKGETRLHPREKSSEWMRRGYPVERDCATTLESDKNSESRTWILRFALQKCGKITRFFFLGDLKRRESYHFFYALQILMCVYSNCAEWSDNIRARIKYRIFFFSLYKHEIHIYCMTVVTLAFVIVFIHETRLFDNTNFFTGYLQSPRFYPI